MRRIVLIAKNEEACKLLECFLSYKKLTEAPKFTTSTPAEEEFQANVITQPPEIAVTDVKI